MCRSHPRAWSPRALDIAAAQLSLRIGLRGESGRVAWAAFFDGIPVSTAVWVESAGSAMCAAAELPGPCCPRACPRRARPTLVHARAGPVGVLCVAAHLINSFFMCAPRDRVRAARLRTAVRSQTLGPGPAAARTLAQHSRFLAFSSLFVRVKVNHKWSRKAFRAHSNRFEMSWRLLVVSCRARRSR